MLSLTLGLLIGVCAGFIWPDVARAEMPNQPGTGALRHRPDRILIKPKAGKVSAALAGLHSTHRNRVAKTLDRTQNIQLVQLSPGQTVAEAVARYQESGLVEFVEPDYLLHATLNPNDPKFLDGTQWNLNNTGQNGGLTGADIHAPGGWETLSSASNIVVAVVDTGIRYTHEDLAANAWVNAGEIPGNGLDDDGNGYVDDVHGLNALANSGDPNDDNGHGTHVAGIIGAVGNNGKGVAGVAWRVQLMACKSLDESGNGNGLFAFADPQFQTVFNSDMPNPFLPNAIVCPYWDSLDTLFGGGVYAGIVGTSPARRLVISWVNVPRTFSFNLSLTFQTVIEEETNRILFQYREVHPESRDGGGRHAAIGVENETGRLAAKYTYNGSPSIVTNGQAIQFVPAFSGSMVVTPGSGLEISGGFGGPFAPENQAYTIENTGQAGFNWAAAKTQEWLSLSATNGLLAPGQSTNVLVALNTNALALKTGSYLDVISFFNLKNGNGNATRAVALTVSGTNSVLSVTPDLEWRSAGPPGGPFNPASQIYTLMNSGDARLDWAANRSHDWISLSSSNGVLRPSESTVITLSIASAATNLPPNSYTGRVDFVNGTSGLGNTGRSVRLFIAQRPSLAVLTDTTQDRFSLRLSGEAGQSCVIETSTNLLKWVPMLANALAPGGWLDFTDAPSSQVPRRFYRGKVLPP